eukprot:gnl/TRDRNA2_/TRDRNA2_162210_c0_seq1.p1 gnl/TRDRNA2_/TRDRNA2_162210_c0~~gnl/TRDRNA2_/TRDRNA2_162210_c0_seq1.p1  ORF type:complete len:281 (-),score=66.46 gnl/TRDRNA2_/TRDRNA2_162210_c0_seq1:64-906(-)
MAEAETKAAKPWVLLSIKNGIATITYNRPERYNAWTDELMTAMMDTLKKCAGDDSIAAAVLTGGGKYYCSGVDFAGTLRPMRPATLMAMARDKNQALFDAFLDFPKPLFAAVNGPAIGASVTSASLCDAILASPAATFHTPFKALGITPEGCSSINFPRLLGEENARKMLEDGRKIDAVEAKAFGLVKEVVEPGEHLLERAQAFAEEWVREGRGRVVTEDPEWLRALKQANREESVRLAESFMGKPFLEAQYNFAAAKGKTGMKMVFGAAHLLQPLLSKL